MKDWIEVTLRNGVIAKIDETDWHIFIAHRWQLCGGNPGGTRYLMRRTKAAGKQRPVYLHRVITNAPTGKHVDHINGDKLDNRRANLRLVTPSQNHQNERDAHAQSKTGVRGVSWHAKAGRYRAVISIEGKYVHLGYFDTIEEAARAYAAGRAKYHTHAPREAA